MSRIHEALEKAAKERSANLLGGESGDPSEVLVEIHGQARAEASIANRAEQQRILAVGNQAGPLRYEELVKRCSHSKWEIDARPNIFQRPGVRNGGAERFRTLRSRLYQIASTRTLRRLLITSSIPAEGKTFVTANLAQSIVQQSERRVLIIDADLRSPRVHVELGTPNRPGLTDYLRGEANEFTAIQRGARENLFLIPAGSEASNPSELLLSQRMKDLLDLVTPIFDWIIIDSPPVLPVHDASILADLTDGVLLVVRAGSTHAEVAEKVAGEFREKNLLGVVLNRVEKSDSYGSDYYSNYSAERSE
jgi:protein-tyrosine kinase